MAQSARQSFLQLLGDVTLSSPTSGQALTYNGTAWVNGSAGVTDHGALTGLSDDDPTQYHNDSRALTWLGTRSPSDLAEGSNLYHTSARVNTLIAATVIDTLSDVTITTPASGQYLKYNGSAWVNAALAAAGSDTQVQYNSSGAFAGSANLTFSGTALTVSGTSGDLLLVKNAGTTKARVASDGQITAYCNTNAGGMSIDGTTNPGIQVLVSGTLKGFVAAAVTSATAYLTDSAVGDIVHRSEAAGARILFGNGGSDPAAFGVGKTQSVFQANDVATIPLVIRAKASQTAALLSFEQKSSTSTNRTAATVDGAWIDSTDASRKARLILTAYDTAAREGLRIDTDGTGANISLFGAGSFGGGRSVVFLPNAAVVPSTNPTGGGILYCESGALKYRGSSGTITTIAAA